MRSLIFACLMAILIPFSASAEFPFDLTPYMGRPGYPVDDPAHYDDQVIKGNYTIETSAAQWVIPSKNLPDDAPVFRSNNNVAITFHEGELFMAYRTGRTHFASKKTMMVVLRSSDGKNWTSELVIAPNRDLREPHLLSFEGKLYLYYFTAGKSMFSFKPSEAFRVERLGPKKWSKPLPVLSKGEVPWDMKIRDGKIFLASYGGPHYRLTGKGKVELYFKQSTDAQHFESETPYVYRGGVSEVGFEFDKSGNLWGVTRNEDGDESGFGSHVVTASASDLEHWEFPAISDKRAFMSPKMFRYGDDLYLVARRQLGKHPFGRLSPKWGYFFSRIVNWVGFSLTPKTTALFKIDKQNKKVLHVMDLPGAGDTSLPSIHRLDANTFLLANYTSPVQHTGRPWLIGQLNDTQIYMLMIRMTPR